MVEVLFQHCADHLLDEVPQWSSAMGPDFVGLTLTDFVMRLTQVPECKSLRFQLCLWLARQVEAKLTDLFGDKAERREQRIFAAPTPVGAKNSYQMNAALAKHVAQSQVLAQDLAPVLLVSLATDKSTVGGLPVQNTFLSLNASQVVFLAIAQVGNGGVRDQASTEACRVRSGDSFSAPFR